MKKNTSILAVILKLDFCKLKEGLSKHMKISLHMSTFAHLLRFFLFFWWISFLVTKIWERDMTIFFSPSQVAFLWNMIWFLSKKFIPCKSFWWTSVPSKVDYIPTDHITWIYKQLSTEQLVFQGIQYKDVPAHPNLHTEPKQ